MSSPYPWRPSNMVVLMWSLILYSTLIVRSFTRRSPSFPLISGRNVVHLVPLLKKARPLSLMIHIVWYVTIHQQITTSCQLPQLSMISRTSLRSCALWTKWLVMTLVITSRMTPNIVSVCHVVAYHFCFISLISNADQICSPFFSRVRSPQWPALHGSQYKVLLCHGLWQMWPAQWYCCGGNPVFIPSRQVKPKPRFVRLCPWGSIRPQGYVYLQPHNVSTSPVDIMMWSQTTCLSYFVTLTIILLCILSLPQLVQHWHHRRLLEYKVQEGIEQRRCMASRWQEWRTLRHAKQSRVQESFLWPRNTSIRSDAACQRPQGWSWTH